MKYQIAERFASIQGEGVYTGTPMKFIRFVGCSVGKKICQHCDTDFEKLGGSWRGGGELTAAQISEWAAPYEHFCLTGGEPLDQDLTAFFADPYMLHGVKMFHVETSGTKSLDQLVYGEIERERIWICVSPKPGFLEDVVMAADEVKVIVPGLGTEESLIMIRKGQPEQHGMAARDTFRWPTLEDALRWAKAGKTVFLQPRNAKFDVDKQNLLYVQDVIRDHPELRLSVQLHKVLKVQ